jgi:hypothetical protein
MKPFFCLLNFISFLLLGHLGYSQDTVFVKDAKIGCKVLNVTPHGLKYTTSASTTKDSLAFSKVNKVVYGEPAHGNCEPLELDVKYGVDWENVRIIHDFCQVGYWKKYKEISVVSLNEQDATNTLKQLAAMKGQHTLVLTTAENVPAPCPNKADKGCRGVKIFGIPYSDSTAVPTLHDFEEFFGNTKKFTAKTQYSAHFKDGKEMEKADLTKQQFVLFEKKVSNGIVVLSGRLGKHEGSFRLVYNEATFFVVYFEDPKLNISYNFVIDFTTATLPEPAEEEEPEKDE